MSVRVQAVAIFVGMYILTSTSPTTASIVLDRRESHHTSLDGIERVPRIVIDMEEKEMIAKTNSNLRQRRRGGFFKSNVILPNPLVRGGSVPSHEKTKEDEWESTNLTSLKENDEREQDVGKSSSETIKTVTEPTPMIQKILPSSPAVKSSKSNDTYQLSIHSIQGKRQYMEDEYFANERGSFVAVMDG